MGVAELGTRGRKGNDPVGPVEVLDVIDVKEHVGQEKKTPENAKEGEVLGRCRPEKKQVPGAKNFFIANHWFTLYV